MTRSRRTRLSCATALLIVVLGAVPASAEWLIVPARPGQLGFGLQGQYGTLLKKGNLGAGPVGSSQAEGFGSGPGLTVRVRYRMKDDRGIGLSFENQTFDARVATVADTAANKLTIFTAGPDVYLMFGTRTSTTRMLSLGAGLAQIRIKDNDGETEFLPAGDGLYVSVGAGVEKFFYQSWALDLSTRFMGVFHDGQANYDVQASLGLIVYASY